MTKLAELRQSKKAALVEFEALVTKEGALNDNERTQYNELRSKIVAIDEQIDRHGELLELHARGAEPVQGQDLNGYYRDARTGATAWRVPASPENDPYVNDNAARSLAKSRGYLEGSARSMIVGGMVKMCALAGGDIYRARMISTEQYGEGHPITRALITSAGAAGGFIVPPDYMNEIIELLRPMSIVRAAGPRTIPMPRGTMRLPGQATPATAGYTAEDIKIPSSQQSLNSIVATYKKLTALVPISNDMMRYADPAVDAFVRDDLVKVMGLREDLAFLMGDGTADTPRGFISFANGWVVNQGGTVASLNNNANSTLGVNGTATYDPLRGANGGNFVTANETFTLATAGMEFAGAIQKLDSANVPKLKRYWFWNPRTENYLFNVQNSLGVYVYRDEMSRGTFLRYPFLSSNQIPTNLWDATGTNKDCSLVFLVEMTEDMVLDSMTLELAVSREGTYVDGSGNTVSAFQNDETLIRAIAEHDHQMRHDSAVAVIQNARYQPQIT